MFRALIADDHPSFRSALRQVIESLFGEYEIFEASTLDEARQVIGGNADLDLDMILLDLQMPGSTGFSGLVALRNAAPEVPIIVVSAATSTETMRTRSPMAPPVSSRNRSPEIRSARACGA